MITQIDKVIKDWQQSYAVNLYDYELEEIIGAPQYVERNSKVWYVLYEDNFYKLKQERDSIYIYCEWGYYAHDLLFALEGLGSYKI